LYFVTPRRILPLSRPPDQKIQLLVLDMDDLGISPLFLRKESFDADSVTTNEETASSERIRLEAVSHRRASRTVVQWHDPFRFFSGVHFQTDC
jgi:hypothetical protein